MTWIVSAFIKDLQDKSSTHWSLVVTLLIMAFARANVYALVPIDAFLKSLVASTDAQSLMVMEWFAFLAAGILLFLVFTGVFELVFRLQRKGKK
ncbi:MAG: hypothetical protein IPJ89_04430 [Candidatus Iainarchaeum archaeon]|uniref:Uncharacterized protein n=1 Tax=Candidatus Iainarchaeum sp. TaxID=3101447 RepID=A0A7T9I1G1_9ARCH|nr:MAG: hypothetical protein IPJ89_04430 [Candidatus Diapherotrites archaeon]